jgi:hypothetical protein
VPSPEVLAENRFLAARDGMDARLIDPETRRPIPVRAILESLLADCRDPRSGSVALVRWIGCSASQRQTGPRGSGRSSPAAGVSTTWS